ncbi:hypothetical protein BAE44_0007234 [Dichanthelium oligosanthes]|uniref:Uncharacterized protein n=1 Tax=Dichanthelium oligosanthes TaxID=888268 RepID=A0A1E5W2Y7_9POAL|nr:hypothetical protein BAE44_0007234 [Dichanthelium oligosanthes]
MALDARSLPAVSIPVLTGFSSAMALDARSLPAVSIPVLNVGGSGNDDEGGAPSGAAVDVDMPALWSDEGRMKRELVAWAKAVASMAIRESMRFRSLTQISRLIVSEVAIHVPTDYKARSMMALDVARSLQAAVPVPALDVGASAANPWPGNGRGGVGARAGVVERRREAEAGPGGVGQGRGVHGQGISPAVAVLIDDDQA